MVGEGVTECEHAFILLEGREIGTKTKMSMCVLFQIYVCVNF